MKIPALTVLFLSISFLTQAQVPDSFLGSWNGTGTLMGNNAEFSMTWEQVLDDQFYKLTFSNRMTAGAFAMTAHGYYRYENSELSGYWFDSRGVSFPLEGEFKEGTLIINWGTPEIEQGRTEYSLSDSGRMLVIDFVLTNGEYTKFGEATYQQK